MAVACVWPWFLARTQPCIYSRGFPPSLALHAKSCAFSPHHATCYCCHGERDRPRVRPPARPPRRVGRRTPTVFHPAGIRPGRHCYAIHRPARSRPGRWPPWDHRHHAVTLTTYDDECAHERRSQARRQSIKGGCSPSDPASFTTNKHTFERTNISKIIERTYPHTNISSHEHILTRTALHLGSETLKLFLCIFSLPKKYNQTILFLPVHSYSSSTRSPRTHRTSDDDVVCGPLPSLRGPGLHIFLKSPVRRGLVEQE